MISAESCTGNKKHVVCRENILSATVSVLSRAVKSSCGKLVNSRLKWLFQIKMMIVFPLSSAFDENLVSYVNLFIEITRIRGKI